jgi:protein phosphatase
VRIDYAALSDPGRRRPRNEDRVLALELPNRSCFVFVVADGVGGADGGAEASQAVVDAIARAFDGSARLDDPEGRLTAAIDEANGTIVAQQGQPAAAGNTTVDAIVAWDGRFAVAHVGDSRAYLLRGQELLRLTEDHSLVAEQVRAGILTEDEASRSARRNIITRSVGSPGGVEIDTRPAEPLREGDVLLLSSDGLHGVASAEEIAGILLAEDAPEQAAARLVAVANERGGPDNVSVVVARVRTLA